MPDAIAAAGGHWWGPHANDVSREDVACAQILGLKVNLLGVGSDDRAVTHALTLGADAITLSYPDLLRAKIEAAR